MKIRSSNFPSHFPKPSRIHTAPKQADARRIGRDRGNWMCLFTFRQRNLGGGELIPGLMEKSSVAQGDQSNVAFWRRGGAALHSKRGAPWETRRSSAVEKNKSFISMPLVVAPNAAHQKKNPRQKERREGPEGVNIRPRAWTQTAPSASPNWQSIYTQS